MLSKEEVDLLSHIDTLEVTTFLQKLVQTESENPPGHEKACALLIEKELKSFNCHTKLQYVEHDRPNVIGTLIGDSKEKLLLNGHMDTVKIGKLDNWSVDPLGGEIIDGKLYGRGACDMKAGLASMIFAMKAIVQSGIPLKKSVLFTAVIDEEVNFKGTTALVDAGELADCVQGFVSEPTDLKIVTEHKGAVECSCEVVGKSAHSGKAQEGINAIARMAKVIDGFEQYNEKLQAYQPHHPIFHAPTLNIGLISGGEGVTFVPEQCKIEFDRQVLPGENIDSVLDEIINVGESMAVQHGFDIQLTKDQSFGPWQVSNDEQHVTDFIKTVTDTLNVEQELSGLHGYCEAEILGRAGIPSLVFGPGDIKYAHAPDEHVPIQQVIDATKVYAIAIYRFVTEAK